MSFSRSFQITVAVLTLVVGSAGLFVLHQRNHRLRERLLERQAQLQQLDALRAENTRLAMLLETHSSAENAADRAVAAQARELRREIAALEQHAAQRHAELAAQSLRDSSALATNRDPRVAPMLLEYFRERGQATPSAAFESLVCAALKGDHVALANYITLSPEARARADALIGRLPPEAQAEWTPEKLATLWITGALSGERALQLTNETFEDPEHAVVAFRGLGNKGDENVKLRLTPAGWRMVVSPHMLAGVDRKSSATPPGH